jgi:hypothetical protein
MSRLINVIRKLLLTCNWMFFLPSSALSVFLFIKSLQPVEAQGSSGIGDWWYNLTTSLFGNNDGSIFFALAAVTLLIGLVMHIIIQWIFNSDSHD